MVKVNDIVRFLNDVGGGKVTRIEGKMVYVEDNDGFERPALAREVVVYVEDNDGFERPALAREVVVVDSAKPHHMTYEKPLEIKSKLVEPDVPAPKPKPEPMEPVFETEEGEVLNIVLAYEPREIKHLNTTTFYSMLVNGLHDTRRRGPRVDNTLPRHCGAQHPGATRRVWPQRPKLDDPCGSAVYRLQARQGVCT